MQSPTQLSWPLSIIAGFVVLLVFIMIGAFNQSAGAQSQACVKENADIYPICTKQTANARSTQTAVFVGTSQANDRAQRETSQASQSQAERCLDPAYPRRSCPTNTPTTTNPGNPGNPSNPSNPGNNQQAATATFTPTATTSITTTTAAGTTPAATPSATNTLVPTTSPAAISPTPTSALPAGVATVLCVPGSTVEVSGTTEPNTPLLLFFADRPVGGGLSAADGSYRLNLKVGDERPGLYLVDVRNRMSRDLVDQIGCDVPALTPTPTLAGR